MSTKETLVAGWKFCLSFLRNEWALSDYPITVREQKFDPDFGHRFEQQRYLAFVVRWGFSGGGDTPEQARRDLAVRFEKMKAERARQGRPLPRPGTNAPIEFAPTVRVLAYPELTDDFIRRVLGLDWAFVSDESSLWDFHTGQTNDSLNAKIREIYGVDVSDIESGNLAEILGRIAIARSQRS